jgi:hypothetical protein
MAPHQSEQFEGIGYLVAGLLFAVMLLLEGCATEPPPPHTQLALSQSAIADAEGAGATEYVPSELQNARDKLNSARVAMNERNYELATFLAQEAEVDARLAEQKTRSLKTEKAAQEVRTGIQTLQNELQRQPSQ